MIELVKLFAKDIVLSFLKHPASGALSRCSQYIIDPIRWSAFLEEPRNDGIFGPMDCVEATSKSFIYRKLGADIFHCVLGNQFIRQPFMIQPKHGSPEQASVPTQDGISI